MRKLLLLPPLLLLASCGSTTHMTDSLTCLGFCARTRIEHETQPAPPAEKKPPEARAAGG